MIRVPPGSRLGRLSVLPRLGAVVVYAAAISRTQYSPWWLLVGLVLFVVLVGLGLRPKAPPAQGAVWSASADLLRGWHHYPGQLSVTKAALIWTPSKSSERRGATELRVPMQDAWLRLEPGPGLFDVRVVARHGEGGVPSVLLTHGRRALTTALDQLSESR